MGAWLTVQQFTLNGTELGTQEWFVYLTGKAFAPFPVRDEPLIFAGCAVKRPKTNMASSKATTVPDATQPLEATEQKVELLIHNLYQNWNDSVHDMRVLNIDAKPHSAKTPEKCLQEAEREKKKVYLKDFLQQR